MKTSPKLNRIKNNQSGMASIVVTMIIMVVITLIVLAAARLSRREQTQSLDRQLNTQAFYAAESGVNDAAKKIEEDLADTTKPIKLIDSDYTSNCNEFMTAASLTAPVLDAPSGSSVSYSCLLVDPTPTTWEGDVNDSSRAFPIRDKGGLTIDQVTIAWQEIDGRTNFSCPSDLPPVGSRSCETPMLRFDIVSTTSASRTALNNSQMTGFLVPDNAAVGSTTIAYAPSTAANLPPIKQDVQCNTGNSPKYCKAVISGLGGTQYYLRLKSIYGGSAVTVSAQRGGSDIELKDAQVVIDSTGKANDILRRIQVRISLTGALNLPEFAIESGNSICKQLEINSTGLASSVNPDCPLN